MHFLPLPLKPLAMLAALTLLAACNSEEQAEQHYERATELAAAGDFDRARVEYLNVFQNNGLHREARSDFAAMLREQGEVQQSYSQYLRLVEQYPDDAEGRIALGEMAIQFRNWEEAERHGRRAMELAPEDDRIDVIAVNLDYAQAVEEDDANARRDLIAAAETLLESDPDNALLLRMAVDNALREGDLEGAMAALDTVLLREPDNRTLQDARLSVLAELEDAAGVEAQLRQMLELFPGDTELPTTLLRFYYAREEFDTAAAFLQDQADAAEEGETRRDALTALVRLKLQTEGDAAALRELERIIAAEATLEDGQPAIFRALRASIRFDRGESDAAIAEMEEILEGDLSPTERGQLQVSLARMLITTGNVVGARALVEQALEADPNQVDAMKMQAAWLIEGDEMDRAIGMLRTALDLAPEDSGAMLLMSQAHARNGNGQLSREFMALAVEASNAAPEESLVYARALIDQERYLPAEEILIDALRLAPGDVELLAVLGQVYIAMEDWPRAEGVETSLREGSGIERQQLADGLRAARLAAQGRMSDAVNFLEALAADADTGDVRAQIAVVRARLNSGDTEGALAYINGLVEAAPEELSYRFTQAAVQSAVGDLPAAEASFRRLTEEVPGSQQGWLGLIRAQNGQGKIDEAEATLAAALEALPDALDLLWAQASFREQAGDYEGAIEIYEAMYARAPNSEVVANNLASLLSTYRDDAESLDRAWTVARRLRDIEFPPFQDTYGWIAYRRGDYEVALEHLEPAAAGLPNDALVQFHLGMAYGALNQIDAALAQLAHAIEMAAARDDTRPQFALAQEEIARLEALAAAEAQE